MEYGVDFISDDKSSGIFTIYVINAIQGESKCDYFKIEMFDSNSKSNSNTPMSIWYETPYGSMLDAILNKNEIEFEGVFDSFTVQFSDLKVTQMEELDYNSDLQRFGYIKP
jgi:hypothetical protein